VPGWSSVRWCPRYFRRGFTIHGYPHASTFPAWHGCVRVPMWLAAALSSRIPIGGPVCVYC
jgi:lipoprotein-anchoring transpeptidase ErfK/SrfK